MSTTTERLSHSYCYCEGRTICYASQMTQALATQSGTHRSGGAVMLENGDTLTVTEFLRRYEAMPELKNAQLIEGIVHMPSPVRADAHAKPDGLIQGWLFNYSLSRPELELYPNATLVLGAGHRKCGATRCHPLLGSRRWRARVAGPQRLPARRAGVRLRDCRQQCLCRPASETSSLSPQRRNCIGEYIVWLTLRWNRR